MSEWQPIETAPTDGTYIVVYPGLWNGITCDIAAYNEDEYAKTPRPYWRRIGTMRVTDCRSRPPTHWMPQPKSPESKP